MREIAEIESRRGSSPFSSDNSLWPRGRRSSEAGLKVVSWSAGQKQAQRKVFDSLISKIKKVADEHALLNCTIEWCS